MILEEFIRYFTGLKTEAMLEIKGITESLFLTGDRREVPPSDAKEWCADRPVNQTWSRPKDLWKTREGSAEDPFPRWRSFLLIHTRIYISYCTWQSNLHVHIPNNIYSSQKTHIPEDIQYDSSGLPEQKPFLFSSHTNVYIFFIQ